MNSRAATTQHSDSALHGPKYSRIINLILTEIDKKVYRPGDRVLSIKEASEEYLISRDTVEKAYKELSQRGVLISVPGKGYYVKGKSSSRLRVMALLPSMEEPEQSFYNQFLMGLGKQAVSHLYCYGNQPEVFQEMLTYHLGDYDFYLVWSSLLTQNPKIRQLLKRIPQNKLIMVQGQPGKQSQPDLLKKLRQLSKEIEPELKRYPEWVLVGQESTEAPLNQWQTLLQQFARAQKKAVTLLSHPGQPVAGALHLVWQHDELVHLVEACRQADLTPGKDIGIICFFEHPLLEAFSGGITSISMDSDLMGTEAANIVLQQSRDDVPLTFMLHKRQSI